VLLHVTCLRRDGHQSASEGARIVVEAVHLDQFDRALDRRRVEPGPGVARVVPERAPSPLPGVHVTCLRRDGHQSASEGARIVVEAVQRSRGWQAFRV
jgi:hypothetical protein